MTVMVVIPSGRAGKRLNIHKVHSVIANRTKSSVSGPHSLGETMCRD